MIEWFVATDLPGDDMDERGIQGESRKNHIELATIEWRSEEEGLVGQVCGEFE